MQNIFENNILLIDGNDPITVKSFAEIQRNILLLQKRAENEPNRGFEAIISKLDKCLTASDKKLLTLYYEEEENLVKMKQRELQKKLYIY